jgi:transposase
MLIAALMELGKLNRQEIAALVGVAPWDRVSGKWIGKAHIFGGRRDVRCVLYYGSLLGLSHLGFCTTIETTGQSVQSRTDCLYA